MRAQGKDLRNSFRYSRQCVMYSFWGCSARCHSNPPITCANCHGYISPFELHAQHWLFQTHTFHILRSKSNIDAHRPHQTTDRAAPDVCVSYALSQLLASMRKFQWPAVWRAHAFFATTAKKKNFSQSGAFVQEPTCCPFSRFASFISHTPVPNIAGRSWALGYR